jgi:hypothetical protein
MQEESFYTFVAYKPDSALVSMGCLLDSYSSDLVFKYELDEDEMAEAWAEALAFNRDSGERGYEDIHVLRDGVLLGSWDETYAKLADLAHHKADDIRSEREEEAERLKEKKEQRAAEERDARDRREYERLKGKFE